MPRGKQVPFNGPVIRADQDAAARLAAVQARMPKDDHIVGVEYLKNNVGCKAILDRRGSDGLPMCCGAPRMVNGTTSVYCRLHYKRFHYGI